MSEAPARRRAPSRRLLFCLPFLLAWLHYSRNLDLPLYLDDLAAIPLVFPDGEFDATSALATILPRDLSHAYHGHFRPVGWASLSLEFAIFGMNPIVHRASAITLHGICGVLVMLLARRLSGTTTLGGPLLAGLLFVSFGGASEPVVWVAHRFTLLAALFLLAGACAVLSPKNGPRLMAATLLITILAALSKDSMLTELWALVPLAMIFNRPGAWLRHGVRVSVVVAVTISILLTLRILFLDLLLPTFDSGGGKLGALSPRLILDELPTTLRMLISPVTLEGTVGAALTWALGGGSLVLVFLGLARDASKKGVRLGLLFCGSLLLLGLPTLLVGSDLDGSRRLYLPASGLAIAMGLSSLGRAGILGWLILGLSILAQVSSNAPWETVGRNIETMTTEVRKFAGSGSVEPNRVGVVCIPGWPPTQKGVPLAGATASHLPLYFRPPLQRPGLNALALTAADVPAFLQETPPPFQLIVFGLSSEVEDQVATLHRRFAFRVESFEATTELGILWPEPDSLWPGAQNENRGMTIGIRIPKIKDSAKLPIWLTLKAQNLTAECVFLPHVLPGSRIREIGDFLELTLPAESLLQGEFVSPEILTFAKLAEGPAVPAEITVRGATDASDSSAMRTAQRIEFRLGARP